MNYATGGWDYVAGGYGATVVLIGGYTFYLRRRARVLARHLPPPAAATAGATPKAAPPGVSGNAERS